MPWLHRLPRWAWFGTGVLAFIAGLINAAGYLGFRHQSISNMTGNNSLLGIALGEADGGEAVHCYLASMAVALQNGVVTTYSGTLIRTTHVTSFFTDLGVYIGHRLRGLPVDTLRMRVAILVATTFMLGSAVGEMLFPLMRERTLLIPAVLTGACGLGYGLYQQQSVTSVNSSAE